MDLSEGCTFIITGGTSLKYTKDRGLTVSLGICIFKSSTGESKDLGPALILIHHDIYDGED